MATAALFSAELVTLDREQLERGSSIVRTLTPDGFLSLEPGQNDGVWANGARGESGGRSRLWLTFMLSVMTSLHQEGGRTNEGP